MSTTLLLFTLAASLAAPLAGNAHEPSETGAQPRATAPALAADSVTIHRDLWGVPHIYAATEAAGFFGLGYAQAEDQLEWVLATVVAARGEMAATFDASGEGLPPALQGFARDLVASDYTSRLWRHTEQGEKGLERLSPQLRSNYDAWAAGIRRWMHDHPERVPEWAPRRVDAADAVAVSRWLLWLDYQAGIGLADCWRGGVRLGAAMESVLDQTRNYASNQWVLAPRRTAEHAMVVLSDPHGGTDGTFAYESRIHAGELNAAGFSIGPMLLLTHTADISWGMTTGSPDVADCYEIETEPGDSLAYRFDGQLRRMETEELVIAVKAGEPVRRTLAYTRHNDVLSPVVARDDGKAYVVSTAYMDDGGVFDEEVWRINHARSIGEVKQAMELLGMFPQNVMFGDRHGDSWYIRAGKAPIRPDRYDWDRPVPGNTSATAWRGVHPLADLYQVESPATGYMQNNNVAPDMMFPGAPGIDAYPEYIFNDRPGRVNSRGLRTLEVLSQAADFTAADAIEIALDEKWYGTEHWQRALRQALAAGPGDVAPMRSGQRHVIRDVLAFDGHARASSAAALAFVHWHEAIAERLDLDGYRRMEAVLWDDAPLPGDLAEHLVGATADAAATLQSRHGGPGATLGDEFRIANGDRSWPLGGGSILPKPVCDSPIDWTRSCMATLRAHTFSPPDSTGRRQVFLGSRLLRLVIFTEPLQSWTLHNYGQSTRPDSPHHSDQARLSSQRALKPVWFRKEELMPNVVSTLVLEVER